MKPEFLETPDYLRLTNGGTRARLAILRESVARAIADKLPPSLTPVDWRAARRYGFHDWRAAYVAGLNQGQNGKTPVWYTHAGEQFRGEKFADQCEGGPDHMGWFTNSDGTIYKDGSGRARGIVGRLTHGRLIAGYWWGDNGERIYFPDVFTDETEAARMADEHARVFAESAQEDNAKFEAARDLEGAIDQATHELCRQFALRHHFKLGADARESIPDLLQAIRDKREELARDYSDYI